jgi:ADP-heptose:LPS heptosyltransferase
MICSDGGAMHVAAALRKPILCFFGTSPPKEWHPWRVPYRLIQKPSRAVADISVAEAFAAYEKLQEDVAVGG